MTEGLFSQGWGSCDEVCAQYHCSAHAPLRDRTQNSVWVCMDCLVLEHRLGTCTYVDTACILIFLYRLPSESHAILRLPDCKPALQPITGWQGQGQCQRVRDQGQCPLDRERLTFRGPENHLNLNFTNFTACDHSLLVEKVCPANIPVFHCTVCKPAAATVVKASKPI